MALPSILAVGTTDAEGELAMGWGWLAWDGEIVQATSERRFLLPGIGRGGMERQSFCLTLLFFLRHLPVRSLLIEFYLSRCDPLSPIFLNSKVLVSLHFFLCFHLHFTMDVSESGSPWL